MTSPLARSASQGIGAVADQGLFSISNFALNLMLARHMAKAEFGAFSSAFAAFFLLATLYSAFVIDPMLVYAFSSMARQQRSYVRNVSALHWKVAALVSFALAVAGIVSYAGHPQLPVSLAYAGWIMAAPAVLWLWFARRTAYITLTPYRAAIAGLAYLACVTTLLLIFSRKVTTNPFLPCMLVALSSAAIARLLRQTVPLSNRENDPGRPVWKSHWRYGKWAGLGGLCAAIPGQIYFFVLSLDGSAAYRAILNVSMPFLQIYYALGPVFVAHFTPLRGTPRFRRTVTLALVVLSASAALLGFLAASHGARLLRILYADRYTSRAVLIWPLMIYSCLYAGTVVLESAMRSLEKVRTATIASGAAAILSLVAGVPAAITLGVRGAAYGLVGSQAVGFAVLLIAWMQKVPDAAP